MAVEFHKSFSSRIRWIQRQIGSELEYVGALCHEGTKGQRKWVLLTTGEFRLDVDELQQAIQEINWLEENNFPNGQNL